MDLKLPDVDWQAHGWTIASQLRKLNEETGEVAEAVATRDWYNAVRETYDFIQVGHTMLAMLYEQWQKEYGRKCPKEQLITEHVAKLEHKGYIGESDPYAGHKEVD